ncbi:MAG: DeoR/GlpR family DNA-binding transcription regulator [Desulfobacterales bacterium]|nr:DeoR/GlpR family DNA-binding transcription regulator [Desulfobacterales bacterium]
MSKAKIERKKKMIQILKEKRMVSLSKLSGMLGVSNMTARRYAGEMEDQIALMGSHVIYRLEDTETPMKYTIDEEEVRNLNKKKQLGRRAASFIEEGDVIFVDAGTTTPFLAEQVPDDVRFTAVCCSLNVFLILNQKKNCTLILTGGEFHEGTQVFASRAALDIIRNIRITKAFISTAGISEKLGLTCFNPYETDLKKEVIKYSQHVYVVADSTKMDSVKIAYFADITQADTLVIDGGIREEDENWLAQAGLDVVKA